jgi:hypothetical protein
MRRGLAAALMAAAFIWAAAFASPAAAGFLGGKDLHGHCTAPSIDERYICISYIMGVIDTTQHLLAKSDPGRACIPAGAAAQETIERIIEYLKTDAERRDSPAEILVGHALKTVYPCKG